MAYINGQKVLFSPKINITGSGTGEAIISVASLPEENISTKHFYKTSDGVFWYDGSDWKQIVNDSDILDEVHTQTLYVNDEAVFGDNDQVTIDSTGITVSTSDADTDTHVEIGRGSEGIKINNKRVLVEGDATGCTHECEVSLSDFEDLQDTVGGYQNSNNSQFDALFRRVSSLENNTGGVSSWNDLTDKPTKVSAFENDVGYLTEHQDLSGLNADIKENADAIAALELAKVPYSAVENDAINPSTGFIPKRTPAKGLTVPTESITYDQSVVNKKYIESKGYLTEHQSLDGYAKTSDIPKNLSELADDESHRMVSDTEKAAWHGKSDFSGAYEDLTGKPTIPTVPTKVSAFDNDSKYVTENALEAKGYLTEHQDISGKQDVLSFDGTYNKNTNKVATVQTVVAEVAKITAGAPENLNSLKEFSDWITTHGTDAARMNSDIVANATAIEVEKTRAKTAEDALTASLGSANSYIQTALSQASAAVTVANSASGNAAQAKRSIEDLQEDVGNLDTKIADAESDISELQRRAGTVENRVTALEGKEISWEDLTDRPFGEVGGFVEIFKAEGVILTEQNGYSVLTVQNPTFAIEIGKTYKVIVAETQAWEQEEERGIHTLVAEATEDQGGLPIIGEFGDTIFVRNESSLTIYYNGPFGGYPATVLIYRDDSVSVLLDNKYLDLPNNNDFKSLKWQVENGGGASSWNDLSDRPFYEDAALGVTYKPTKTDCGDCGFWLNSIGLATSELLSLDELGYYTVLVEMSASNKSFSTFTKSFSLDSFKVETINGGYMLSRSLFGVVPSTSGSFSDILIFLISNYDAFNTSYYASLTSNGTYLCSTFNDASDEDYNMYVIYGNIISLTKLPIKKLDKKYLDIPKAGSYSLGTVMTTSMVTSKTNYTACPIIEGVPYYKDTNTTYSNWSLGQGYGTCSTAATTLVKTVSAYSYALSTGGIVAIRFTNTVPANASLNINSKGAKPIYYRGVQITANVILAGDIASFIYTGSQYILISVDRWGTDIASLSSRITALENK